MADVAVAFVLKARNEVSAQLQKVSGELGGLSKLVGKFSSGFGIGGLGVSSVVAAGAALAGLAVNYAKVVEEAQRSGSTLGMSATEFARVSRETGELTYQLKLAKQQWSDFSNEVGKRSAGATAGTMKSLNDMFRDFTGGPSGWANLAKILQGPAGVADWAAGHMADHPALRTEPTAQETARLKRINDLMQALRISRVLAADFADQLDRIEQTSKNTQVMQTVFGHLGLEGRVDDTSAGNVQPRRSRRRILTGGTDGLIDTTEMLKKQQELVRTMSKARAEAVMLRESWIEAARDMTQATALLQASFSTLYGGVEGGLRNVISRFRDSTQTLKGAAATMANTIVAEFEAMAARIAAIKILAFLAGFLPGVGPVAAAAVGAAGGGTPRAGAGVYDSQTRTRGATGPVIVNNNYITAFDAKSMQDQIQAPTGAYRQASKRVQILRRAGHNS